MENCEKLNAFPDHAVDIFLRFNVTATCNSESGSNEKLPKTHGGEIRKWTDLRTFFHLIRLKCVIDSPELEVWCTGDDILEVINRVYQNNFSF